MSQGSSQCLPEYLPCALFFPQAAKLPNAQWPHPPYVNNQGQEILPYELSSVKD